MKRILMVCAAALIGLPAVAAAPDLLDSDTPANPPEYRLDTVLVVHNWVLCVSQTSAEQIARARDVSVEAALRVYGDLVQEKACGKFAKLGVMLRVPLYRSGPGRDYEARVFAASVNIGVGWQSGFVVYGGVPE